MKVSIAVCCLNAKETRSAAILRQDFLLPYYCRAYPIFAAAKSRAYNPSCDMTVFTY